MQAIQIKNIHKSYAETHAVRGLSCSVNESECFGFLGPNGAGKTTLMKMLYGKARQDTKPEGSIQVFGLDPRKKELDIKMLTGIVPQEDNLDQELNVLQNLLIFARFYGLPKAEAHKRIEELLDFMELKEKKQSKIRELSGGMKRRLTIARALLNNPKLLILDEPTTGLDPQVRHLIWDKLRELRRQGVTILITTHYMDEAFQICDRVMIMDKGEKIMEGKPATLLKENIEPFVLEVHRPEIVPTLDPGSYSHCSIREDRSHHLVFFYSDDLACLKHLADQIEPGSSHLRQSNLEDLFLKITGRSLNESQ